MDRAKLAQLRRKKLETNKKTEADRHEAILKSHDQVFTAVNKLAETLEAQDNKDVLELIKSIDTSKELEAMVNLVNKLGERSDQSSKDIVELISKNTAKQNEAIAEIAIKLSESIQKQSFKSQEVTDFVPTRRVRKVGNRFVFDDDPMQVSIVGGGGSSFPKAALRNNNSIAVVNPDGTPIVGGGGGGGDVAVTNFPDDYALPDAQVATLTPQTDALTDDQLRATPVPISGTVTANVTPAPIFDIRNIEEDVTYKYFGFEERGGTNWRIMRKTLATNTFMYATGTTGYATAWTNKASETYL